MTSCFSSPCPRNRGFLWTASCHPERSSFVIQSGRHLSSRMGLVILNEAAGGVKDLGVCNNAFIVSEDGKVYQILRWRSE